MREKKHLLAEIYENAQRKTMAPGDWLQDAYNLGFKIRPVTDLDTVMYIADFTVEECHRLKLDLQNDTIVVHGDPRQKIFVDTFIGPKVSKIIENPPESEWEFRLIRIAAFILPETTREEWLGDLKEALLQLRYERHPRWIRTLIAAGRVCLLGFALIRITVRDLVPAKKRRSM